MKIRRDYQISCPACHASAGRPCQGKQAETLRGVHFERTRALRSAALAAFKCLYAPLTSSVDILRR